MSELMQAARDAYANAYTPRSGYPVGAALRTADGTVVRGCNYEVTNYGNTVCAQRVAVGTAVCVGHREFARLRVATAAGDVATPCGTCRQTLAEFCDDDLVVRCAGDGTVEEYTPGELLPEAFRGGSVAKTERR